MESDDKSEQLKQLIQIGKSRGYILYHEIDELLPLGLEGSARLDTVLTELARNGIEILEEPGARYDIDVTEGDKIFDENNLQRLFEETDNSSPMMMYVREVMTIPRQTREKEIELAKRISFGGEDAEDAMRQLIEANLYLVVAVARRHGEPGHGLLELIQEGNIGLMKAAEKYNHAREYRFSTYAIWWIRGSIVQSKLAS